MDVRTPSRLEVLQELQRALEGHRVGDPEDLAMAPVSPGAIEYALKYLKECPWPSCGFCHVIETSEAHNNVDIYAVGGTHTCGVDGCEWQHPDPRVMRSHQQHEHPEYVGRAS